MWTLAKTCRELPHLLVAIMMLKWCYSLSIHAMLLHMNNTFWQYSAITRFLLRVVALMYGIWRYCDVEAIVSGFWFLRAHPIAPLIISIAWVRGNFSDLDANILWEWNVYLHNELHTFLALCPAKCQVRGGTSGLTVGDIVICSLVRNFTIRRLLYVDFLWDQFVF